MSNFILISSTKAQRGEVPHPHFSFNYSEVRWFSPSFSDTRASPLTLYCSPSVSIMRISTELSGKDILRNVSVSLLFSLFCLIKKLEKLVLVNLDDGGVDGDPVCVWKTSALSYASFVGFVKLLNYSLPQFPCQYHGERASQVALLVKNLPANAGDIRDVGSVPGSGRSPGGGRQPTPVLLPGESHGQRSLAGYSP